jgi:hypothetical protein
MFRFHPQGNRIAVPAISTRNKSDAHALQYLRSQLGIKVMLTPKFHCKFAGEGIEYNRAHAKAKMQRTPIREKKAALIS